MMAEAWRQDSDQLDKPSKILGLSESVSFIEQAIGFDRSKLILELGCSAGYYSLELSRRGYLTVGIDDREERLKRARQCAEREGLTAQFARGEAKNLIYKAQFDVALLLCVGAFGEGLNEESSRQVLKQVAKVLKPQGLLIMTVFSSSCLSAAQAQTEVAKDLHDCGFVRPNFFSLSSAGYRPSSTPLEHLELGVMVQKASLALAQQVAGLQLMRPLRAERLPEDDSGAQGSSGAVRVGEGN